MSSKGRYPRMMVQEIQALWDSHSRFYNRRQAVRKLVPSVGRALKRLVPAIEDSGSSIRWFEGPVVVDGSRVATVHSLEHDLLTALFQEHTVCAIHVKKFAPRAVTDALGEIALREYTNWKV